MVKTNTTLVKIGLSYDNLIYCFEGTIFTQGELSMLNQQEIDQSQSKKI